MKILVINCGSSSLKYQLIDMENEHVLAKGLVERIGIEGSILKHESANKEKEIIKVPMEDHKVALKLVLEALVNEEYGAIASMDEISAVGHRVVHGGEKFAESCVLTEEVIKALEDCTILQTWLESLLVEKFFLVYRWLLCSILHSTKQCQKKHSYTEFLMNIMKNMELENMDSTVHLTDLCLFKLLIC